MKMYTFLMFTGAQCGKAKEAIDFYVSTFPNSEIKSIENYKEGEQGGRPDLVKHAIFIINGIEYMASENTFEHAFNFTPSISTYINCETKEDVVRLFNSLSEGGKVMMSLDDYGFSKQFGWCADKYGVSWQINLP